MKKQDNILSKIDGELKDLNADHAKSEHYELIDALSDEALNVYRHSCAHLLAQAVVDLFPHVQYGVGPAVENGFYYDFLTDHPFTPEDLKEIAKKMNFLIKQNVKIEREIWTKAAAIEYFTQKKQMLKVELIQDKVTGDEVSVYKQGNFTDVCRGPHLPATHYLKHFELLSVAASYWKGDETSHSLQRIYGTVFPSAEQLADHLNFLKEAEKRDHRRLGKDLDLFSIKNEIGAGLVLWHPKGSIIRYEIEKYWKEEHLRKDYQLLYTPHIAKHDLWNTSGHNDFYKENMFTPIEFDNTKYQLKPMNCPFHIEVYKAGQHSYREFPLRWAELGTVYRYERSGALHGLLRVRGFTQDDAHIFCTPAQLNAEVEELISFSLNILKTFGFTDLDVFLSTRPEKYVGELTDWESATAALQNALQKCGVKYQIDPGEGVFYGPKIDIKVKDVLKRSWQCTTIQIDFNLPKRFNLRYSDDQGALQQPIMIHRALLGSIERFFGVLIEHYAGAFPVWLSPLQAIIVPVTERNFNYAEKIHAMFKEHQIRVASDTRNEGIGRKIRDAELQKIPFIIIIGDEEEKNGDITYRIHKQGDKGKIMAEALIKKIGQLIATKGSNYEN